jgi:hypothetical protein
MAEDKPYIVQSRDYYEDDDNNMKKGSGRIALPPAKIMRVIGRPTKVVTGIRSTINQMMVLFISAKTICGSSTISHILTPTR